jgi:putative transposase
LADRILLKIVYLLVRRILGLAVLVSRTDLAKDAELLVLRYENAVLRRHLGRVRYEPADRVWLAALARLLPRKRWTEIFAVPPATLLTWHRKLAASKYDTSSRRKPGRPPTVPSIARLVVRASEGESAVGIPQDPWRSGETRRDRRAIHRLGDPAHCGN